MNRRCDAVNADGSRCENIIEPSDVSNHSIKQPFGYVFGIMCVDHWKQLDSGMKVTIREDATHSLHTVWCCKTDTQRCIICTPLREC